MTAPDRHRYAPRRPPESPGQEQRGRGSANGGETGRRVVLSLRLSIFARSSDGRPRYTSSEELVGGILGSTMHRWRPTSSARRVLGDL